MRAALSALEPKMLTLASSRDAEPRVLDLEAEQLDTRVARAVARIEGASFGNPTDKEVVPALYKNYVGRIAGMLERTLAIATRDVAEVEVPTMPAHATDEEMRAWHLRVLRAQHETIVDALSGKRIHTLTECVPMALDGKDADGKPLGVCATRRG